MRTHICMSHFRHPEYPMETIMKRTRSCRIKKPSMTAERCLSSRGERYPTFLRIKDIFQYKSIKSGTNPNAL